jgi:hypothetical protein
VVPAVAAEPPVDPPVWLTTSSELQATRAERSHAAIAHDDVVLETNVSIRSRRSCMTEASRTFFMEQAAPSLFTKRVIFMMVHR